MINHLALVSETSHVRMEELMRVSAALAKQIVRDFSPIWGIPGTIDAFARLEDVPTGYWPIIVMDDIGYPGAAGIHLDDDGKPFGLVDHSEGWSLTASHEALEMLGDPLGNTLRSAPSIHPAQPYDVDYLVEVCDPSEAWEFGYDINGIRVSDFYTPEYFLPFPSGNIRYSYTGAISQPRQVLKGGYVSWLNPSDGQWWQQTWFSGDSPRFRNLGRASDNLNPRSWLDRQSTPGQSGRHPLHPGYEQTRVQNVLYHRLVDTTNHKADRLRAQIRYVIVESAPRTGLDATGS